MNLWHVHSALSLSLLCILYILWYAVVTSVVCWCIFFVRLCRIYNEKNKNNHNHLLCVHSRFRGKCSLHQILLEGLGRVTLLLFLNLTNVRVCVCTSTKFASVCLTCSSAEATEPEAKVSPRPNYLWCHLPCVCLLGGWQPNWFHACTKSLISLI